MYTVLSVQMPSILIPILDRNKKDISSAIAKMLCLSQQQYLSFHQVDFQQSNVILGNLFSFCMGQTCELNQDMMRTTILLSFGSCSISILPRNILLLAYCLNQTQWEMGSSFKSFHLTFPTMIALLPRAKVPIMRYVFSGYTIGKW